MTPKEYQQLASRTECDQIAARSRYIPPGPNGELLPVRLNHAVMGMTGEIGELAGALERWLHYGKDLDKTNIKEELGDMMWYVALACNALEFDLDEVMGANIRKLRVRYPDKYTDIHAEEANRDRSKERNAIQG